MEKDILEIANSVFNDDSEDIDKPLKDFKEFDSMNHVQLLLEIEMKYDISFDDSDIKKDMTVRDIVGLIHKKGL